MGEVCHNRGGYLMVALHQLIPQRLAGGLALGTWQGTQEGTHCWSVLLGKDVQHAGDPMLPSVRRGE
jgi:hypothetical protein